MTRRLSIAVAIALAGAAGPALAQEPAADECKGLATPAEEIACLRSALKESRTARSPDQHNAVDAARVERPAVQQAPEVTRVRGEAAQDLGEEQIATSRGQERSEPEKTRLQATASAIRTDHLGLVTLRLDNGQVWQQTEALGVPLRLGQNRSYPVEISPSGFGGYRMQFTETGRRIVVRRLS